MVNLAASALFFVGIHLLISGTSLRDRLVARLGERRYMGLFSLLSAGALIWMIWAFIAASEPQPTAALAWRWLALLLNGLAFVLIAFGVLARSPTAVGGERLLNQPDPARGMQRITRHPMLSGFALWAATHMAFNPQPAALVFFGAFLALSVVGPASIDAKRARRLGEAWTRYAAVTSALPFGAIIAGRNRLVLGELLAPPLWAGLAAFALFAWLHPQLFGVPVY